MFQRHITLYVNKCIHKQLFKTNVLYLSIVWEIIDNRSGEKEKKNMNTGWKIKEMGDNA